MAFREHITNNLLMAMTEDYKTNKIQIIADVQKESTKACEKKKNEQRTITDDILTVQSITNTLQFLLEYKADLM